MTPDNDALVERLLKDAEYLESLPVRPLQHIAADLREAAARLKGAEGWRDISTAPKDGTPVWLWLADEGVSVKGLFGRGPENDGDMWWLPEMDLYQTDAGFHEITHWRHLPASPKE